MPTIEITDSLNATIVTANPVATSGLGKYFKGTSAHLLAVSSLAGLQDNNKFREKRVDLEKRMANVIRKNRSSFGDPWGLLAMFQAAQGAATASATLTSPRLTITA